MKYRYENEQNIKKITNYDIILMKNKNLKHLESTEFESTPLYHL